MTMISLNPKTSTTSETIILPTDIYRMKIVAAVIEDDKFAEKRRDGTIPQQLVLTWEVSGLSNEQLEIAEERGEDWSAARLWQRMNPYYGTIKDGGPSKFMAFMNKLQAQGHFSEAEEVEADSFVGIEQRVSVQEYIKTMGANAGQPGNKVIDISAIRKAKNTPTPIAKDDTF